MIYDAAVVSFRAITNDKLFLPGVSRTFHGRDIFAPSAAHLASGVLPARFGKLIRDYVQLSLLKPRQTARRVWSGTVLKVDRFGNLITNLHADELPEVRTRPFDIRWTSNDMHVASTPPRSATAVPASRARSWAVQRYLKSSVNQRRRLPTCCIAGRGVQSDSLSLWID